MKAKKKNTRTNAKTKVQGAQLKAKTKVVTKKKSGTLAGTSVPVRSRDSIYRRNADGSVALLLMDNDRCYFQLDKMAAQFWIHIDNKTDLQTIVKTIADKNSVTEESVRTHSSSLMAKLRKEKLISW